MIRVVKQAHSVAALFPHGIVVFRELLFSNGEEFNERDTTNPP